MDEKKNPLGNCVFAVAALAICVPFAALGIAISVNVTVWAFTGHDVFPWVTKAFSQ